VRYFQGLLVACALAAAVAPVPSAIIERWYSQRLYPALQPVITGLSSRVPIALLDVAVTVFVIGIAIGLLRRWRAQGTAPAVRHALILTVVAAATCYLWFLGFWGLNYRRVPLEQKLSYDKSRVTREQGMKLGRIAVEQVNALQPGSLTAPADSHHALSVALAGVERQLGATRVALVAEPKRSVLMWYFRKAAIDGMTDPFFLEVILNPDLLPFERPFVLAHEWAHLAGYADESEANFIAWLTCVSGSPAARYSGWLAAYQHVAAALPREDRRQLAAALHPGVVADLAAARQRLARSSPAVRTAARGAYDTYLKANRVEEGIASYDAVVRLLLGTTFDLNWKPVLRQIGDNSQLPTPNSQLPTPNSQLPNGVLRSNWLEVVGATKPMRILPSSFERPRLGVGSWKLGVGSWKLGV